MNTNDVVSLISKIREKVNRLIMAEMAQHGMEGIVTSHGDIIDALLSRTKMTMAEIAAQIGRDKSTVTVLVDKLTKLGYVTKERDAEDTRVIHVALTPKGRELGPAFEAISGKLIDTFYRGIPEDEKEELVRILAKVYHNF